MKMNDFTIDSNLLVELRILCRDLDTLNPRNTNAEGLVCVGPGRLANWQDVAKKLLPLLEAASI